MPIDHQVNVHVPEPRENSHPFSGYHFSALWNHEGADLTDRLDSLTFDNDDAVPDWLGIVSIDEGSSYQRFDGESLRVRGCLAGKHQANDADCRYQARPTSKGLSAHFYSPCPSYGEPPYCHSGEATLACLMTSALQPSLVAPAVRIL